ncbi:hypothetical protein Hdeb2414_s0003g00110391 [Helianthus debilis subsp. tardiflorus]
MYVQLCVVRWAWMVFHAIVGCMVAYLVGTCFCCCRVFATKSITAPSHQKHHRLLSSSPFLSLKIHTTTQYIDQRFKMTRLFDKTMPTLDRQQWSELLSGVGILETIKVAMGLVVQQLWN